jgi:predicted Zn-dependent protease
MKRKGLVTAVGVLLAVGVIGGAWWRQAAAAKQFAVAQALPAMPSFEGSPTEMRERIAAADSRARSLTAAREGLAELAQLYHANGFLEEAMRCYQGLERTDGRNARWPHLHGTILSGFGETEPALNLWKRVMELAPDYIPARLRIADCLLKAARPKEAAEAYAAILKANPAQPYALFGLARIDFEAGRLAEARERLEAVVSQTNYQLGYDFIVTVYERLGLKKEARALRGQAAASGAYRDPADPWLDALIEFCYDPYRLSLNAGIAARTGDPKTAQRLLERGIELTPNDVALRFQLGTLAAAQGNVELAADQLQRCTLLSPEFADAWAHLSALQAQRGDHAAAERTLASGLRAAPESPGLHLMKARTLREAGRMEDAVNEFMVAARLRPNEADAYIELGSTLITLDRVAEALEQLKAAVRAEPDNPMALAILAFHAITTGDEAAARSWLTRVGKQPRTSVESRNNLAAAYSQQFGRTWIWSDE